MIDVYQSFDFFMFELQEIIRFEDFIIATGNGFRRNFVERYNKNLGTSFDKFIVGLLQTILYSLHSMA